MNWVDKNLCAKNLQGGADKLCLSYNSRLTFCSCLAGVDNNYSPCLCMKARPCNTWQITFLITDSGNNLSLKHKNMTKCTSLSVCQSTVNKYWLDLSALWLSSLMFTLDNVMCPQITHGAFFPRPASSKKESPLNNLYNTNQIAHSC